MFFPFAACYNCIVMDSRISAIVLAAGMSRRMGAQKLLLPWHGQTVIGQVVATLLAAGVGDIVVVTGAQADEVEQALSAYPVRFVRNPLYPNGEMIDSIRAGLSALGDAVASAGPGPSRAVAALLCLGDQPQMEAGSVSAVMAAGAARGWASVVIPSYQMHSGHPILLPASVWPAVMAASTNLRDVLRAEGNRVDYLAVATPSVLADLDTPEDYRLATTP